MPGQRGRIIGLGATIPIQYTTQRVWGVLFGNSSIATVLKTRGDTAGAGAVRVKYNLIAALFRSKVTYWTAVWLGCVMGGWTMVLPCCASPCSFLNAA